jgi:hypothetical protein
MLRWVDGEGKNRSKKVVPKNIGQYLNPRSLAYWYQDDGTVHGAHQSGYRLHTEGFNKAECVLLASALRENFGFSVNIHKKLKYQILYIPRESRDRFTELIYPHVVPAMRYKLII